MAKHLLPSSITELIAAFEQLPGIGSKTAQRLVFYLLRADRQKTAALARAADQLFTHLKQCTLCSNFSEEELCSICQDMRRDQSKLCVVGETLDILALEQTGHYSGRYHVLHGVLSPLEGIGPEHLSIEHLIGRIREQQESATPLSEVILATSPTLEGEATALYLAKLIAPFKIPLTRIARGLPTGGDLGYADPTTLRNSLEGRKVFEVS